jgi:hypothetical protein
VAAAVIERRVLMSHKLWQALCLATIVGSCTSYGEPPIAYRGAPDPQHQFYQPPYYWSAPGEGHNDGGGNGGRQ